MIILDVANGDYHYMMGWWYGIFGEYMWAVMVVGWLIYAGTSVYIAYFVHKDAIKRNITNSEIWMIFALVTNIVGLLIYLLLRGNYNSNSRELRKDETDGVITR